MPETAEVRYEREVAERLAYMQVRCHRCNHMRGSHTEDAHDREAIGTECCVCQITRGCCPEFIEPKDAPHA